MLCDPCSSDNVEKVAVIYCQDCSQLFCEDCKKCHAKIKLDKTHSLRGIECVPSQTDRNILHQLNSCPCREQNTEPLVYFCKDHDTFCCGTCGFSKHRKCNHVDKIEDVLVDTTGQAFDEPVGVLETKIKELTDLATENTQLADKSYNDIEKRLDEVKRAIDEAYDDLKTKVLNSAKTRHQEITTEIQQKSQNIESLSMKLNEEKARAETVAKYGTATDMHIFNHLFQKSALKEMNSSENKLRSSLMPRQLSSHDKHSIDEIARKLKEAIEIVDKDLVTGSDNIDGIELNPQPPASPAAAIKPSTDNLQPLPYQLPPASLAAAIRVKPSTDNLQQVPNPQPPASQAAVVKPSTDNLQQAPNPQPPASQAAVVKPSTDNLQQVPNPQSPASQAAVVKPSTDNLQQVPNPQSPASQAAVVKPSTDNLQQVPYQLPPASQAAAVKRSSAKLSYQQEPTQQLTASQAFNPFSDQLSYQPEPSRQLTAIQAFDPFSDQLSYLTEPSQQLTASQAFNSFSAKLSSYQEQRRRMREGIRVVRGRDWPRSWNYDGGAGGKGTVVEVNSKTGKVRVKWDCSGHTGWYYMGKNDIYRLQLVD